MSDIFQGKLGLQQRVLAEYRIPFFDELASHCANGLEVFAGEPRPEESIAIGDNLATATHVKAQNVHLGRGRFYLCWQRGYRRWLRQSNIDVLIVATDPRILSSYLAIRQARSNGSPVIGWGLGTLSDANGGIGKSAVSALRSRLYRSYDAVIAYSSKAADDYRRAGVLDERIFVANNAISTSEAEAAQLKYPADGEEVRKWRENHELTKQTIIFVGRLIPEKRLDLLIEACRATGDAFDLLIVGDGPEREALERIAADRYPGTRFIGHKRGDELSLAFAASDFFVLPGAGGLAIYEAMAHAKPVIVGKGDGTEADLVQDGRNGLLVEPDDLGKLTEAIKSYIGQTGRIHNEGLESRKMIREQASIEKMATTFISAVQYVSGNDS